MRRKSSQLPSKKLDGSQGKGGSQRRKLSSEIKSAEPIPSTKVSHRDEKDFDRTQWESSRFAGEDEPDVDPNQLPSKENATQSKETISTKSKENPKAKSKEKKKSKVARMTESQIEQCLLPVTKEELSQKKKESKAVAKPELYVYDFPISNCEHGVS